MSLVPISQQSEIMRANDLPSLASKEIRLSLAQPTKMELGGTEHEAITRKTLGRSNKRLLLGSSDASIRRSPHLAEPMQEAERT